MSMQNVEPFVPTAYDLPLSLQLSDRDSIIDHSHLTHAINTAHVEANRNSEPTKSTRASCNDARDKASMLDAGTSEPKQHPSQLPQSLGITHGKEKYKMASNSIGDKILSYDADL